MCRVTRYVVMIYSNPFSMPFLVKNFRWILTNSNKFWRIPTNSDEFQRIPTNSNEFQQIPTNSNKIPTISNEFQWIPTKFQQIPTSQPDKPWQLQEKTPKTICWCVRRPSVQMILMKTAWYVLSASEEFTTDVLNFPPTKCRCSWTKVKTRTTNTFVLSA